MAVIQVGPPSGPSGAAVSGSGGRSALGYALRRAGLSFLTVLVSMVILGILWQVTISMLNVNPFLAKKPGDVFDYFFKTGQDKVKPSEHWRVLGGMLKVTLGHAAIGFVFGVVGSVVLAMLFMLVRPLEFMFLPIALVARTVPLLAMAPVIFLIFGKGAVTAGLIGAVVVFFPILVNLAVGFRSVSPQTVDLVRVNGGSRLTILRKVAFPTALPQLMASMRIAAPGAITGAMLYEWLFTFSGLGAGITSAKADSDYPQMWAIVVLVTVVSILLYTIMTFVEAAVLARWGADAGKAR